MTAHDFEELLDEALGEYAEDGVQDIKSIRSFEDAGVLTKNAGIVIKFKDGNEFQITIVKSA